MTQEIERKFLLHSLPSNIDVTSKVVYERYFLEINQDVETRIQRKGDKFYREHKTTNSKLSSDKDVVQINKEEFDQLRQNAIGSIERDSYTLPGIPNGTIKVYHGRFEGLIRAEVEFPDVHSATHFSPPSWFGSEISDSSLGRDSRLLNLSGSEFKSLLKVTTGR